MDCDITIVTRVAQSFQLKTDPNGATMRVMSFPGGEAGGSEQEVMDDALALEVTGRMLLPDPTLNRLKVGIFLVVPGQGGTSKAMLERIRTDAVVGQEGHGLTAMVCYRRLPGARVGLTFVSPSSHRGHWRNLVSDTYQKSDIQGTAGKGKPAALWMGAVFETRDGDPGGEWTVRGQLAMVIAGAWVDKNDT